MPDYVTRTLIINRAEVVDRETHRGTEPFLYLRLGTLTGHYIYAAHRMGRPSSGYGHVIGLKRAAGIPDNETDPATLIGKKVCAYIEGGRIIKWTKHELEDEVRDHFERKGWEKRLDAELARCDATPQPAMFKAAA